MEWMAENSAALATIVGAALALGGLIVKFTPTKTDDKWWGILMGLFGKK